MIKNSVCDVELYHVVIAQGKIARCFPLDCQTLVSLASQIVMLISTSHSFVLVVMESEIMMLVSKKVSLTDSFENFASWICKRINEDSRCISSTQNGCWVN